MNRALTLLLPLVIASGCSTFDPAELPEDEAFIVAVLSCELPPGITPPVNLAHHSWFMLKKGSELDWAILEVITTKAFTEDYVVSHRPVSGKTARRLERWDREVHLHTVVTGEDAERMIPELEELAAEYEDSRNYRGWAGPNSNTFVDYLGRHVSGLRFELHHNAVGKNYAPLLRACLTSTGMGVEFDTYLFGVQLGIEEGFEFHFLNLTFGVDFFPPALKLPFLPRLGFQETTFFR